MRGSNVQASDDGNNTDDSEPRNNNSNDRLDDRNGNNVSSKSNKRGRISGVDKSGPGAKRRLADSTDEEDESPEKSRKTKKPRKMFAAKSSGSNNPNARGDGRASHGKSGPRNAPEPNRGTANKRKFRP